jgi:predicted methyltransferase
MLGAESLDFVFICDTYHHFEYPRSTLASIHRAMKPGAEMVIIDFDRIPGQSRQWVLDHVRCDRQTVIQEVQTAGFALVEPGPAVPGLKENFTLRFRKAD